MYVPLAEWLALLEDEYLREYIPAGGAAVRFVVTVPPVAASDIIDRLQQTAQAHDLHLVLVDSAHTKIHMIDHLFHAVARQIGWDALARDFVCRLLEANGFQVPADPQAFDYPQIAELNQYTEGELRRDVRNWLITHVYKDFAMAQEFRIAMLRLCQAQLEPAAGGHAEAAVIKEWLRGELRLVSALKPALIFQKIARHNARDMFLSLAHWLRLGRKRGLVLGLDISRYTSGRRPAEPDGTLYHATNAALDAYEVLRQFVDATDELESCCIVVVAPPEFLEDEKRGLARYTALKLRVWDEVRDRRQANPLSALVRLCADAT